jgi:hypothetical protein
LRQLESRRAFEQDAVLLGAIVTTIDAGDPPVADAKPEIAVPCPIGIAQVATKDRRDRVVEVDSEFAIGGAVGARSRDVRQQEQSRPIGELDVGVEFRHDLARRARRPTFRFRLCPAGGAATVANKLTATMWRRIDARSPRDPRDDASSADRPSLSSSAAQRRTERRATPLTLPATPG